jgi:hypothetical protein
MAVTCPTELLAILVAPDAFPLPFREVGIVGFVVLFWLLRGVIISLRGFVEDLGAIENFGHFHCGGTAALHRGEGELLDAADDRRVPGQAVGHCRLG